MYIYVPHPRSPPETELLKGEANNSNDNKNNYHVLCIYYAMGTTPSAFCTLLKLILTHL